MDENISSDQLGIVLSGGGVRASYQVGVLKAICEHLPNYGNNISVIVGASIGAVNAVILDSSLHRGLSGAVEVVENVWRDRTYENTFAGSLTVSFFRSIKLAFFQSITPGPVATDFAIFDPTPLIQSLHHSLTSVRKEDRSRSSAGKRSVAVMTTQEGKERTPLLIAHMRGDNYFHHDVGVSYDVHCVKRLGLKHAFASAALPWVLPPVEILNDKKTIRLVDGGICDNVPVDPAIRLGADTVLTIDTSGRSWWHDQMKRRHYERDEWEIEAAKDTYCLLPKNHLHLQNKKPLGEIVADVIGGRSAKNAIRTLGPIWPVYKLLKVKLGEVVALEIISYVFLHPDFISQVLQLGYDETTELIKKGALLG